MEEAQREVVRLSLGEGQPTLNVLSAETDGERMSVLCPFPILHLDVPVKVTLPGDDDGESVSGSIRSVKVDMNAETGLPRFKLQLDLERGGAPAGASADGISIEIDEFGAEPQEEAAAEEAEGDEPGPEDAEEAEDSAAEEIDEFNWPLSQELLEAEEAADEAWDPGPKEVGADPILDLEDDPPWAASGLDQEIHDQDGAPRKRSRWPVRVAVSLALAVSVAAVAYVLRQQVLDLVGPFVGDEISLASLGLDLTPDPLAEEPDLGRAQQGSDAPLAAEEAEEAAAEREALLAPAEEPETNEPPAEELLSDVAALVEAEESPEETPEVQTSGERIRVTLPTQWPVSEARSYRLHDPTGIVVDVPGGMAARAAQWIDTSHDRVRSVRVVEREEGVRFIIYLNDESVPRYRVGYGRTGVTVDIMGPDPRHASRSDDDASPPTA